MIKRSDPKNATLHSAKKAKNDEFYTQLHDIEREVGNYESQLKDKMIFCNCDDPFESNFFKYFVLKFNFFGLKKLIATSYACSSAASTELPLFDCKSAGEKTTKVPYKIEISEVVKNPEAGFDITAVTDLLCNKKNVLSRLKGNGDFRSPECIELLKESDVVITNPPFSLFREYVAKLDEYKKKFLIVGNKNAITYKEIFKLIKENKMWVGNTPMGTDMLFDVPEHFAKTLVSTKQEGSGYKIVNGIVKGRAQAIWFTNLDLQKRHEKFTLYKKYSAKEFPKYDNYDAIEVSKVVEIPMDYDGIMGVPISFLDKYNPEQFEIVGSADDKDFYPIIFGKYEGRIMLKGREPFKRIFIRKTKSVPLGG